MPVVFTADVQARSHQQRSTILPNGRNSRLQNALDCLVQAGDHAGEGGTVVINGDLFDDRFKLEIDVLDSVTQTIFDLAKKCLVVLNPGNHDQFLRDGSIHSLRVFEGRPNILVVPQEGITIWDRERTCQMWLYPFTEKNEHAIAFAKKAASEVERDPAFLVLHMPVQSAVLGNGEADTSGVPVTALHSRKFVAVILGHYHKPQQVADTNVFYVGSPYQVNSGERGDEKRFLVWGRDKKLKSVPVVGMPRFVRVSSLEEAKEHPQDFVDLICEAGEDLESLPSNVVYTPKAQVVEENAATETLHTFDVDEAIVLFMRQKSAERLINEAQKRVRE